MGFDHEGPDGANFRDSTCVPQAVRWDDPRDMQCWLDALLEVLKDLRAAGRDRCRRKRRQVLSRHEADRQVNDGWRRGVRLVQAGQAGLGVRVPREPEPLPSGGADEEPPFSSKRPKGTPPDAAG